MDANTQLNTQFKEKVVPFCKEHHIAMLAVTPGVTTVLGTPAHLSGLLGSLFEVLLEQKVFTVTEIVSFLALAKATVEKNEEEK